MDQQFDGRVEALATLDRRAQLVHRMQWLQPCAHQHLAAGAGPQRGDVRRHQAEVEHHVVDHRQQRRVGVLDTGRARSFAQGFEEGFGQLQVGTQPAFASGVGQVQVHPQKLARLQRLAKLAQQLRRIDFAPRLARAEGEGVEQAEQVVFLGQMQRGMAHSNSQ
ncbi:hypothetical protein D9M71_442200 [compost metagenome]